MASRQRTSTAALPPAEEASVLPDLPEAAVSAILQQLPLRDRLSSGALVCRSWAAIAAAVTADVDVELSRSEQWQQLHVWLRKHGGRVQRLSARPSDPDSTQGLRLQLPAWQLVQLRSLDLSWLSFQLAPQGVTTPSSSSSGGGGGEEQQDASGAFGGAAALLPQLQQLRLSRCRLTEQSMSQLLSATALSMLEWHICDVYDDTWTWQLPRYEVVPMLWELLQELPQLSELRPGHARGMTAAEAAPVSELQHLQSLSIALSHRLHMPTLAELVPAGLTALSAGVFGGLGVPVEGMPAAAGITRLSSLASLQLMSVDIAPSCLSGLTGLRELRLHEPEYAEVEAGPRELLGALQHLTQLRHLLLAVCRLDAIQQQQGGGQGGYQCFSALTASSQLTALALRSVSMLPVPLGAVDHMFPAGRVLPHLRELVFKGDGWDTGNGHCVEAATVARIAAGCPALQQLTLHRVTPPDFDCSCLLQLPSGLAITHVTG